MHLATVDDDRLAGDVGGCGRSEVEAGVANVLHLGGDHPRSHPRSSEIIIRDYPRLDEISRDQRRRAHLADRAERHRSRHAVEVPAHNGDRERCRFAPHTQAAMLPRHSWPSATSPSVLMLPGSTLFTVT